MHMTLARALKYKNRVTQKVRQTAQLIQNRNSIIAGNPREYDVRELLSHYDKLMAHLVDLKDKIATATRPVHRTILAMEELRAKIEMLRSMSINHGKSARSWREETEVVYEATIREKEQMELIAACEREMDAIQEKLDTHNATTKIEVDVLVS